MLNSKNKIYALCVWQGSASVLNNKQIHLVKST